jgi:hypothetical protein
MPALTHHQQDTLIEMTNASCPHPRHQDLVKPGFVGRHMAELLLPLLSYLCQASLLLLPKGSKRPPSPKGLPLIGDPQPPPITRDKRSNSSSGDGCCCSLLPASPLPLVPAVRASSASHMRLRQQQGQQQQQEGQRLKKEKHKPTITRAGLLP